MNLQCPDNFKSHDFHVSVINVQLPTKRTSLVVTILVWHINLILSSATSLLTLFTSYRTRLIFVNLTNFMRLSPTWEAASYAATQELPSILWNPQVHCRVHKSPPLVPNLNQINAIHTILSYLSKFHFNIRLPSSLFPSGFPTYIQYPIRATSPAHLILLDLIILIMIGKWIQVMNLLLTYACI
jgi:hypothetical protein